MALRRRPLTLHPIHSSTRIAPNSNGNAITDEIMPHTVQEAQPSSSSAPYTDEQLKAFLERNWNTIRDQRRYLVEGTETAVRCAYCKDVVELGADPSKREASWAAHLRLHDTRPNFLDDPHCKLTFGGDSGTLVSCSACQTKIGRATSLWVRERWQKHIETLYHRGNVGEAIPNTATSSDMCRQRFVEDPAAVILDESDMEVGCLLCARKIKLNDPWAWQNWELHSKSRDHQVKAGLGTVPPS
ncbi:hypothetical protein DFP72DRAFT_1076864 [Ephemerocybe angulata]|uniref:Uncharacterized protein n=1 Tax=Ephemerocybe angulata TaxID=980116 RepID=A0A8H6HGG6_9AGAR|nr:hypothetical protein DFP72DRAFT_1076864 [Tulosesus angulatus]